METTEGSQEKREVFSVWIYTVAFGNIPSEKELIQVLTATEALRSLFP